MTMNNTDWFTPRFRAEIGRMIAGWRILRVGVLFTDVSTCFDVVGRYIPDQDRLTVPLFDKDWLDLRHRMTNDILRWVGDERCVYLPVIADGSERSTLLYNFHMALKIEREGESIRVECIKNPRSLPDPVLCPVDEVWATIRSITNQRMQS